MSNLLKEAIADAKAVKATALANARAALEETFQPTLQRMISSKLAEDGELEDEDPTQAPPVDDMGGEEEDLELEAILRELENDGLDGEGEAATTQKLNTEGDNPFEDEDDSGATDIDPTNEGDLGDEVFEALMRELEGDGYDGEAEAAPKEKLNTEVRKLRKENHELQKKVGVVKRELREAYQAITTLKGAINEVNLLNSKLMYSSKIIRNYELNERQQLKVLENFDRAANLREVKLVYSTLTENLRGFKREKAQQVNRKPMTESVASKPIQAANKRSGNEPSFVPRWQVLAGLKPIE
jgi:hypothetical protein